ncbi:hypothetical protein DYB32_009414 [Aphanomyces invadans]|uniref:GAG-pre-integrase domain-containing protein n=1 Tax=Aphanomyces invadans TaxID=157072 RepID=A0A418AIP4_9STRA|nr:hypothetical protein DYB32_009414 [Aphanomyces invadans]
MNTPSGVIPVVLIDDLFIPTIQFNLFSLSRVTSKKFEVAFREADCYVTRDDQDFAFGVRRNNLYFLDIANPLTPVELDAPDAVIGYSLVTTTDADTWHARLDHISLKHTVKTKQYTTGIELPSCKHQFCSSCLAGKQSRLPFPQRSLSSTDEPFALVHSDLCGSTTRARYNHPTHPPQQPPPPRAGCTHHGHSS